ncbi:GntR family transcriptional regulator [Brevibacterium oceani]|uniref:GntR family transcriptional regulator n=1 Tax=Brevibacterium oceani TaxID=358099 RepID=UPI001B344E10|nr:GntR family transcriptional regulator [Brevibacterium oceani]
MSAEKLATQLREAIVEGRLVPNQRLVETDIAEEYGASRGNVRIALSELTTEGLIERIRHRGARVRAVSIEEAVEIIEVRSAVESLCASKAAAKASDAQIEQLQAIGTTMSEAVSTGALDIYAEQNRRLHALIIDISGQATAADTIRRLRGQAVRHQFRLSAREGRPAVSLPQHLKIIDAITDRDSQAASAAMHDHLSSVAEAIAESE